MKRLLLCLPFLFLPTLAPAQGDCTLAQYQKFLTEADQATAKGQYDLAINKLQSAKTCRPEMEAEVGRKILVVFDKVNGERQAAIRNAEEAKRNAAEAERQKKLAQDNADKLKAQADSTRLQQELVKVGDKQLEEEQQRKEKSSRSIANTDLAEDIRDKNSTLALRLAQYNLRWYPDHPNALSNLYKVIADTSAVFFTNMLKGHKKDLKSLVFSADGKFLASGSADKTTIIWAVSTWEKVTVLENTRGKPAFSPDGKYLAVGTTDSTTVVWVVGTWEKYAVLKEPEETWCVAFSSDNRYVATGGGETARIWERETWTRVSTLKIFEMGEDEYEDPRNVEDLAFSPDNRYLLILDMEQVKVWKAGAWKEITTLKGFNGLVYALAFSPDGKYLATGNKASALIWNTETWKLLHTIHGSRTLVHAVAFSPDGRYLATGHWDNPARIWETGNWHELALLRGNRSATTTGALAVAFSADNKYLATGSADNAILLWEVKDEQNAAGFKTRVTEDGILAAFSPDGKYLVANTIRYVDSAKIVETGTWKTVADLKQFKKWVGFNDFAFSYDNRYVAAGCSDESTIVWETATGNQWAVLDGKSGAVERIAFSPDGKYLATASRDRRMVIWDMTSKEISNSWGSAHQALFLVFSPDGRYLCQGGLDKTFDIWDVNTGILMHAIENQPGLFCGAFSPDGKYIAAGGPDNLVKVWEFGTWKQVWVFQEHLANIRSVHFSADGRYLASGSNDNTGKIWDMATGKSLATMRGAPSDVLNVAFSPDDQFLYTFSRNGTAGTFRPLEDCIDCRAYHYSLSELRAAGLQPEPPDLHLLWEQGLKLKETELRSIGKTANKNK